MALGGKAKRKASFTGLGGFPAKTHPCTLEREPPTWVPQLGLGLHFNLEGTYNGKADGWEREDFSQFARWFSGAADTWMPSCRCMRRGPVRRNSRLPLSRNGLSPMHFRKYFLGGRYFLPSGWVSVMFVTRLLRFGFNGPLHKSITSPIWLLKDTQIIPPPHPYCPFVCPRNRGTAI